MPFSQLGEGKKLCVTIYTEAHILPYNKPDSDFRRKSISTTISVCRIIAFPEHQTFLICSILGPSISKESDHLWKKRLTAMVAG